MSIRRSADRDLWVAGVIAGTMALLPLVSLYYPLPEAHLWAYPVLATLTLWRFNSAVDKYIRSYTGQRR